MTDPVHIDFQIGGVADVEKAFQTVDKIMARFERTRKAGGERAVKAAKDEAGKMADAHIREWTRFQKAQERILRTSASMAGREAKRSADGDIRESKRVEKDAERRAKFLERLRNRGATAAGRLATKEATTEIKEAERAARARERLRERSAVMAGKLADKQAKEEGRAAEKAAREWTRGTDRAAREHLRSQGKARAKMDGAYGRIGGIVGGTASKLTSTAMTLGAGALTLGGGLTIADSVNRATSAERAAIALSNSAYIPGQTERPDKKAILARAGAVQSDTNIDKAELIKGMSKYVALSSDFKGGMGNLGEFAKMSKATGTDFGELMTAAGTMRVQNKNLDQAGMMNVLRGIVGQSKNGAIEFADLAQHAGTITATSGQYGGSQASNQQKLLGLAQLGRRVADPAEAATAVNKLATDVASHATGMEAAGVKVRDKNGLLDPADIIANLMEKTGGDIGKLQDLGIGERSMKLFNASKETFKDAGGGKAGAAAVRKEIAGLEGANYSEKDIQRDFAEVMSGSGEKFDAAVMHLREAMEQKLIPYIDRFAEKLPELIPKIERAMDAFESVASFLLNNPYQGVGAAIGAAIAKDVAAYGIGKALESAFSSSLAQRSGPFMIPIAAAAITIAAVNAWGEKDTGDQKARARVANQGGNEARDIAERVRNGTATPQDIGKLKSLKENTEAQIVDAQKKQENLRNWGGEDAGGAALFSLGRTADRATGSTDTEDAWKARDTALTQTIEKFKENIELANKALQAAGEQPGGGTPNPRREFSMSSPQRGGAAGPT